MANLKTNNLCGEGGRNAYSGSLFFDGDSSYLALGSGVISPFGTNDFTIEFWINQGVNASNYTILLTLHTTDAKGFEVAIHSSTIHVYTDTGAWRDTGYAPVSGVYEHIAFQRDYSGNTLKMYANGEEKWSVSNTANYNSTITYVNIGSYGLTSYGYFQGYISNLRICTGHLVYSSNYFTPPTSELKVHYISENDKTVLLCCQDSDDPTQEATGKTITGYGRYYADTGELFTDTGFNATTGWTGTGAGGWTTTGNGVATHAQGTAGNLTQSISNLVVGQTYKLEVDVVTSDDDVAYFYIEELSPSARALGNASNAYVGHYEHYFKATATTHTVGFRGSSLFNGTITNLKLQSYGIGLNPKMPEVIPPYGVDAGNTFGGAISMNSPDYMYFPTGGTEDRGRGRAVIWMGIKDSSGNYTNNIDFIQIQTLGNSTRFGDLGNYVGLGAAISSSTRGVFAGGSRPTVSPASGGNQNFIEYVTIATTGNGQDFGGVSTLFRYGAGISNSTRGLICGAYQGGGASGTLNNIQYVTIATLGDTQDFGDIVANSGSGIQGAGSCSSTTRGITFGGGTGPSTVNEMNYITIGTLGNSVDFGDLSAANYLCQGVSNGTRGVVAGGDNLSGANNRIEYITIASTGDTTDFGDLSSISEFAGATGGSNKIRGVFVGRGDWTAVDNAMSYITIATTGNAQDFGDIRTGFENYGSNALSDSHGGLS